MRREFFVLANGSEMQRSSATLNGTTGRQNGKGASRQRRRIWKQYQLPYAILQQKSSSLKTAIIEVLSGAEVAVNTATFKNDPAKIASKDDVITYLIHLGYLGYNEDSETAFIPNEEIRQELITAVKSSNWNELIGFQEESRKLLMATLAMDTKRVAAQKE